MKRRLSKSKIRRAMAVLILTNGCKILIKKRGGGKTFLRSVVGCTQGTNNKD
jgi:hypothetical protein